MSDPNLLPLLKFMSIIEVNCYKIVCASDPRDYKPYEHFIMSKDDDINSYSVRRLLERTMSYVYIRDFKDLDEIIKGHRSNHLGMELQEGVFKSEFAKKFNEYLTFLLTGIILSNLYTLSQNDFLNLLKNAVDLYSLKVDRNTRELRDDEGRILLEYDYRSLLPRKLLFKTIIFLRSEPSNDGKYYVLDFNKWTSNDKRANNKRPSKEDKFLRTSLCSNGEVEASETVRIDELSNFENNFWISKFLDEEKKKKLTQLHNEVKENLKDSEFKDMKIGDRKFSELVDTLPTFEVEVKSEKKENVPYEPVSSGVVKTNEKSSVIPFKESISLYFKYRIAFWFSKDDFIEKEKNFKESKICSSAKIAIFILDIILLPLHCLLALYKSAINKESVSKPLSVNITEITPKITPDCHLC